MRWSELTLEDIREHAPEVLEELREEQRARAQELEAQIANLREESRQLENQIAEAQLKEELHRRQIEFPSIVSSYQGIPETTKRAPYFCQAVARCRDESELLAYLNNVA